MIAANHAGIRRLVIASLEEANVVALREHPGVGGFVEGGRDIALDELEMDSLAYMEFCISIELNAGVSIVPQELLRLGSLARVAEEIRARRA